MADRTSTKATAPGAAIVAASVVLAALALAGAWRAAGADGAAPDAGPGALLYVPGADQDVAIHGPDSGDLGVTRGISHPIVVPFPPGMPGFPCYGSGSMPFPTPPGMPTAAPRPTPTPGPATGLNYRVCPQLAKRVPASVQQQVSLEPWRLYGYGMLLNPNVPHHPVWNPYRTWMTLLDYGKPWSPCNPVVLKAGCP